MMSLLLKVKKNILGNVDSGFFTKNKVLLAETNYALLRICCLFSACMCAFLLALTFINGLISNLTVFYSIFTAYFILETIIVFTVVKRHKNLSFIFYYLFAIAILFLAAYVGTVKCQDNYAVTFYVFLIMIPMLYVTRPIYANLLSIGACIAFCLLTYFVKKDTAISANDILNAVCCCIVGIGFNITIINIQLSNLQTKVNLERLSTIDELTSLSNRRYFNRHMCNIVNNKVNNISVIMMDIDNFKSFNDSLGHLKGDECLQQVGKVLHDIADKYSLFVSRYGGEEFIAVSDNLDLESLKSICNEIIMAVSDLNIAHRYSPFGKITISIGYADFQSSGAQNETELIACADSALYQAKTTGKNSAVLYSK